MKQLQTRTSQTCWMHTFLIASTSYYHPWVTQMCLPKVCHQRLILTLFLCKLCIGLFYYPPSSPLGVDGKSFVEDVQPSSKILLEPLCRGSDLGPIPRTKRWTGEVNCALNLCSGNYEFCYLCPGSLHIQVSLTAWLFCMCIVDLSALMYFIVFQNCFLLNAFAFLLVWRYAA